MTLALVQEEHGTPDGTRQLVLGRPTSFLSTERLDDTARPITCFFSTWAPVRGRLPEPPRTCLQRIEPGRFYLQHHERNWRDMLTGRVLNYCAPCALREAAGWDIREVTP